MRRRKCGELSMDPNQFHIMFIYHSYATALRAHFLTQQALAIKLLNETNVNFDKIKKTEYEQLHDNAKA